MKMRAALYYGSGDVRIESVEVPSVGPHEVLVKIEAALTCGSDLKAYRQGGHPVLVDKILPSPFGHELAGVIVELGKAVRGFKIGQRVVAANSAPCDRCDYCAMGRPNLCDNLKCLNGAYAEYIVIPEQIVKHNLYEVPEHVSYRAAALSEPLACAVHAFHRLPISRGDTVVILGCGIMGLLFSSVAKQYGARIIAVGRNDEKLARAKQIGVDEVIDAKNVDDPLKAIRDLTVGGRGADVVVEAVGRTEAWEQAFLSARKGGTVCLFGGCAKGSRFSLDTYRVHYEEVAVVGVFHHTPEHFAESLRHISAGHIDTDVFVTSEVSLDDIGDYFQRSAFISPFKAAVIP